MQDIERVFALLLMTATACAHGQQASPQGAQAMSSTSLDCRAPAAANKAQYAELPTGARGVQDDTGASVESRPLDHGQLSWIDSSGCSDATGSQGPHCEAGGFSSSLTPPFTPKTRCSPEQAVVMP